MISDHEIMAQVLEAFRAEQAEHRQAAGELLLELERDPHHPDRRELLNRLFREAHSLKGGARAAGLLPIEQIAHRIEDLFAAARTGTLELTPSVCDPIYAGLDAIGSLFAHHDAGESLDLAPYSDLLAQLQAVLGEPAIEAAPAQPAEVPPTAAEPAVQPMPAPSSAPQANNSRNSHEETGSVRIGVGVLDSLLNEAGELLTCTLRARQLAHECAALGERPHRWRRTWQRISPQVGRLRQSTSALDPIVHHLRDERASIRLGRNEAALQTDLTPLVGALDQANQLILELSSAINELTHQATDDHTRLAAVTERLHRQVHRTRMLPLAGLVPPLQLQLREMARSAGKQAQLIVADHGAEADRQVLDQLRDMLTHLLRNAIDHGIEAPEQRIAAGKPPFGTIELHTTVQTDQLVLRLSDDGSGVDLEQVRQRAVAYGIYNPAEAERATASELLDLLFRAGFSTRQTVSEISGRGVGLDLVRNRVERMRGRVTIESEHGCGTSFFITLPLSLIRAHGLLLQAGGHQYVLPLDAVERIVAVDMRQVGNLEGRPVLQLDQRAIPLAHLADLLNLERNAPHQNASLALILGSSDRQSACLVDAVLGEQELVNQRLPAPLNRLHFVSGVTILADGRVLPILDVVDLMQAIAGHQRLELSFEAPAELHQEVNILVVDDSITTRILEKNILESAGYHVLLATDGQEALQVLQHHDEHKSIQLVLSDIDMPRLNGFELTEQVRNDPQLRTLPIVLVTSLDSPADRARGVAAGADAYIVKRAFDQRTLLETIARLL